jgi:hypothetical protein
MGPRSLGIMQVAANGRASRPWRQSFDWKLGASASKLPMEEANAIAREQPMHSLHSRAAARTRRRWRPRLGFERLNSTCALGPRPVVAPLRPRTAGAAVIKALSLGALPGPSPRHADGGALRVRPPDSVAWLQPATSLRDSVASRRRRSSN